MLGGVIALLQTPPVARSWGISAASAEIGTFRKCKFRTLEQRCKTDLFCNVLCTIYTATLQSEMALYVL